jgi:hypothetical protein
MEIYTLLAAKKVPRGSVITVADDRATLRRAGLLARLVARLRPL